tara:strand:+ start:71 stop:724 length:654 start_codon:yes stop_codon:yes gene_type:complete
MRKPKLDDRGYPTEASDEQMAVLHDKVMTNRYITGANKFGEYPKPKTTMQLRREAHQQKIKDIKEKKKTAQLIKKFAVEESSEPIIRNPYMKKAITDAEILEKLDKQRGPSMWSQIYDGMSPHEKGSWNAEYRKKGFNGKTGDALEPITKTIPKEVNQIMNIELDNIRQMRMEAEEIRNVPERILEIKKKERAGLHEDFVKEKLLVGSILKGEDEKI